MNPQDVIKGYRIIRPIGAGGAGYLYQAEKGGLEVCLKECRFGLRADDPEAPDVVRLFEREVSTLRSLNHPGIPKYYDSFSANDGGEERLYLAMELVQGRNLADLVADRRISLDYVLKVAQEITETLLYTHAFVPPIIHRDIKPENIIQPDAEGARVKLVDFGSVTGAVLKRTMATHNTIAGTPGYAAPEIWHGKECPATDIYSLGATLLYLLSAGRTPGEFLNDDLRLDFKGKLNGTPAWLEQLVHEMTEPNVTRRVKNAGELLGRLYNDPPRVTVSSSEIEIVKQNDGSRKDTHQQENSSNGYLPYGTELDIKARYKKKWQDVGLLEVAAHNAITPARAIAERYGRNGDLVTNEYHYKLGETDILLTSKEEALELLRREPSLVLDFVIWRYATSHWRYNLAFNMSDENMNFADGSVVHWGGRIGVAVDHIGRMSIEEHGDLIRAVRQGCNAFAKTKNPNPGFLRRLFRRNQPKLLTP